MGAHKLEPIDGQKVIDRAEDVQVVLSMYACLVEEQEHEVDTASLRETGLLDREVVDLAFDASKANAASDASEWDTADDGVSADESICDPERDAALELNTARDESVNNTSEDVAPLVKYVPVPAFPAHRLKSVKFDLASFTVHEVIPYGEIYGAHPRTFVFDKDSQRIPAARGGFVSAESLLEMEELQGDSSIFNDDDDGDWESWLRETEDDSTDYSEFVGMYALGSFGSGSHPCIPDLDDESGWETWLEATSKSA
jgi:hypothetical protein